MKFGNVLLDHAAVFMARRKCLAKSAIRGEVAVTTVCNVSRQGLQHRFETPVPAGLQKVRTHRGRVDARRNRVGQVLLGDAGREANHDVAIVTRDVELARQRRRQRVEQGHRQDMQGRTRQIHRVVWHPLLRVVHHERVRELDPEPSPAFSGVVAEFADQLDAPVEL